MIGKTNPSQSADAASAALGTAALADGTRPAKRANNAQDICARPRLMAWRLVLRRVADHLEKQGHKVFAPTLTGLGERAHLISAQVEHQHARHRHRPAYQVESLDNIRSGGPLRMPVDHTAWPSKSVCDLVDRLSRWVPAGTMAIRSWLIARESRPQRLQRATKVKFRAPSSRLRFGRE